MSGKQFQRPIASEPDILIEEKAPKSRDTETFPLEDVLHVLTGKMLGSEGYDSVWEMMSWMLNYPVDHLSYPSALLVCRESIGNEHLKLATDYPPDGNIEGDVDIWLDKQRRKHGNEKTISRVEPFEAKKWKDEFQDYLDSIRPKRKKKGDKARNLTADLFFDK